MWTAKIKDEYDREARLKPVLVVCIPLFLLFVALGLHVSILWTALIAPLVGFGFVELLTQLGGDMGKRKEPALFELWGGKPTSSMLHHRNHAINPIVRERYIGAGRELLPTLQFPNELEEERNPTASDHVYDAFVRYLIERTRDKVRFPLVFKELVNYGFRRNLWGMKSVAVSTAIAAIAVLTLYIGFELLQSVNPGVVSISALAFEFFYLAFWLGWVNPAWVKLSADRYADRLLESCEVLRTEIKAKA
jgi:hypothetical protein